MSNKLCNLLGLSTLSEEALYAQFRWLMQLAAKDPVIKKAIVAEAVAAEKELIAPFFLWKHHGKPAGNGWNRSLENAVWGVDYFDPTGTAKSNMFDTRPNETQYFYTDNDSFGHQLKWSATNQDGSLTLYASAKSPGKDKESNWLPAPGGQFSLYIRTYWGQIFDP
jgi:hypothetical protein